MQQQGQLMQHYDQTMSKSRNYLLKMCSVHDQSMQHCSKHQGQLLETAAKPPAISSKMHRLDKHYLLLLLSELLLLFL